MRAKWRISRVSTPHDAHHGRAHRLLQPALKLLELFRGMAAADAAMRASGRTDLEGGMAALATSKAQAASRTMAAVQPLGAEDAQRWVDYWISQGFFD